MLASGSIFAAMAAFAGIAVVLGLAMAVMRLRHLRAAPSQNHDDRADHGANIVQALPIAVAYFDAHDRLRQVIGKLLQLLPMVHAFGSRLCENVMGVMIPH